MKTVIRNKNALYFHSETDIPIIYDGLMGMRINKDQYVIQEYTQNKRVEMSEKGASVSLESNVVCSGDPNNSILLRIDGKKRNLCSLCLNRSACRLAPGRYIYEPLQLYAFNKKKIIGDVLSDYKKMGFKEKRA